MSKNSSKSNQAFISTNGSRTNNNSRASQSQVAKNAEKTTKQFLELLPADIYNIIHDEVAFKMDPKYRLSLIRKTYGNAVIMKISPEIRSRLMKLSDTSYFINNAYWDDEAEAEAEAEKGEDVDEFVEKHSYHELYTLTQIHHILDSFYNMKNKGEEQFDFLDYYVRFALNGFEYENPQYQDPYKINENYQYPSKVVDLCKAYFDIYDGHKFKSIYWDKANHKPYVKNANSNKNSNVDRNKRNANTKNTINNANTQSTRNMINWENVWKHYSAVDLNEPVIDITNKEKTLERYNITFGEYIDALMKVDVRDKLDQGI